MRATRIGAAAALISIAISAPNAFAGDLDIWPASDDEVGAIKWSGAFVTPYFGYESLSLTGSGHSVLNNPSGWRIGGEAGYDFQLENIVLGVAADGFYTWYDGNGKGAYPGLQGRLSDYATFRGRLGYAFGRFMVYGTGGYAIGDLSVKDQTTGLSDSHTLGGWTAGAGVDWAYRKDLFLRFEVGHIQLDQANFTSLPAGQSSLGANLDLFKVTFISRF